MPKHDYTFYVYIITNKKHGTLYTGMTNNIRRRMFEHKNKVVAGFSKRYGLDLLVYLEFYKYVNDATRCEKQLKNWHRKWKIALIEADNPHWEDLSRDWYA